MTNADLARSYIWKSETRIDALEASLKMDRGVALQAIAK
jgi:hypothetical protein